MSFICESCKKWSGPRVKPIVVVPALALRAKTYDYIDAEGEPQSSVGSEIIAEFKRCPSCMGAVILPAVSPDYTGRRGITNAMHAHARKCNQKILGECKHCVRNITDFRHFEAQALSACLTEPKARMFTSSLASVVVENLMARSLETSHRAKHDFEAGFAVMKAYEERGGGL